MLKMLRGLASLVLLAPMFGWAATDSFFDVSGTITTGGTSQTLAAANPGRKSIHITHSTAESEVLCVNTTSAANCSAAGTYVIAAGGFLCLNTKERVNIVAATTGHKFTAKESADECPALANGGGGGAGGAVTVAQLPAALGSTTGANSLSVVPASDATFTLASTGYSAAVTLTRTADTNAYAAGDVVGAATGSTAALQFSSMGPSGGRIMITSVSIEIDASAIISGETSYTLYLYNVTPPSALGDNAAFDLPSGDRASFLGSINLGTPVDLGSTLFLATDAVNKQIKLSGTSLFGYLVTTGAYTPTSARVYVVTIHAVSL